MSLSADDRNKIHEEFIKKQQNPKGYGVDVYSQITCPFVGVSYYDNYSLPLQAKDAELYYESIGGHSILYNGSQVPITFLLLYLKNPLTTPFAENPLSSTIIPTGYDVNAKKIK